MNFSDSEQNKERKRMPSFTDDLSEFLRILNEHDVQYLIIGGYATMLHTSDQSFG